jgi:hydroxymethylglutaryl-CoA reductase (NADPH)
MVLPIPDSGLLKRLYAAIIGPGDLISLDIPDRILQRLYTYGSLKDTGSGSEFKIKNRLQDAKVTDISRITVDNNPVELANITLKTSDESTLPVAEITEETFLNFPVGRGITVHLDGVRVSSGQHNLEISFTAKPFGDLTLSITDVIRAEEMVDGIPRDSSDNYSEQAIQTRHEYINTKTGTTLDHVGRYSIDPAATEGNIENFIGVAQIPIGVAGPMMVNGEHANGEYPIPLATTEATLVASYSRGMKAINLSGGAKTTVADDKMNRAPVFVFENARDARDFRDWMFDHYQEIKTKAEGTTSTGRLVGIDDYLINSHAHFRFDFTTGDAAGQNMVGKATFAACNWMLTEYDGYIENFYLEGNLATDKKSSKINDLNTRGKRVTAEVTIDKETMVRHLGAEPSSIHHHAQVATLGAFLSGANTNAAHPANGLASLFIATGQDEANVAESSAAIVNTQLRNDDSLHVSITIPSLIVATYGGGTGLPTQQECLEMLGCRGSGKVMKLAEIAAATVLAGELSLASAISASDWVASHEELGRNS